MKSVTATLVVILLYTPFTRSYNPQSSRCHSPPISHLCHYHFADLNFVLFVNIQYENLHYWYCWQQEILKTKLHKGFDDPKVLKKVLKKIDSLKKVLKKVNSLKKVLKKVDSLFWVLKKVLKKLTQNKKYSKKYSRFSL